MAPNQTTHAALHPKNGDSALSWLLGLKARGWTGHVPCGSSSLCLIKNSHEMKLRLTLAFKTSLRRWVTRYIFSVPASCNNTSPLPQHSNLAAMDPIRPSFQPACDRWLPLWIRRTDIRFNRGDLLVPRPCKQKSQHTAGFNNVHIQSQSSCKALRQLWGQDATEHLQLFSVPLRIFALADSCGCEDDSSLRRSPDWTFD